MSETERISDLLHRSFYASAWHGPSLLEALDGVDAAMASTRTVASAHTIWELVLHIESWMSAATACILGQAPMPTMPFVYDFPLPAGSSETEWQQTLSRLEATFKALLEAVGTVPDASMDDIVAGRKYHMYFLLHGMSHHTIYHCGQIVLLKKTLQ